MSARESILEVIRRNKPFPVAHPGPMPRPTEGYDLVGEFSSATEAAGGTVVRLMAAAEVARVVGEHHPHASSVGSAVPDLVPGNLALEASATSRELAGLDVFVCRGAVGVAESGAIWVAESSLVHRAAPFITEHLVIVLDRTRIVPTLHEAYANIAVDGEGFGAFIAGPSKTADIEQSLVIGAHGPRSLLVILVGDEANV